MFSLNFKSREQIANVVAVLFCIPALHNHIIYYIDTERMSGLLQVFYSLLVITLFLIRQQPNRVSFHFKEWGIAIMGTCLPFMLRPVDDFISSNLLLCMQFSGTVIAMIALCNLNRSFGLVAADRGIKTQGLYRVIRHPIYTGYFIASGAYVAMNPSWNNIVIYSLFLFFECWRLLIEEDFLINNPAYMDYKNKVRWRIIPFVF